MIVGVCWEFNMKGALPYFFVFLLHSTYNFYLMVIQKQFIATCISCHIIGWLHVVAITSCFWNKYAPTPYDSFSFHQTFKDHHMSFFPH